MPTYFSKTEYTYTGQTSFTTPPYLQAPNITVKVNGTLKTQGVDYTLSGTAVTFDQDYTPDTGATIRIERFSSQDTRSVNYETGSMLKADTLDADAQQLFYMAQEALDIGQGLEIEAGTDHPTTVSTFTNDAGYLDENSVLDLGTY
jgi:hypothetical protein